MAERVGQESALDLDSYTSADSASPCGKEVRAEEPPAHVQTALASIRRNAERTRSVAEPRLDGYAPKRKRTSDEQRNVDQIARVLTRHGWQVEREVPLRGEKPFRCDLLVTHQKMRWQWGAIEVKGDLGHFRTYCDATKQAIDYTGAAIGVLDDRVAWSALWPHPPRQISRRDVALSAEEHAERVKKSAAEGYSYELDGEIVHRPGREILDAEYREAYERSRSHDVQGWADCWAVQKFTSLHYKVLALCRTVREWDEERRGWIHNPDGAELVYSLGHVVWSTRTGFSEANVKGALGKRQVGGQRL